MTSEHARGFSYARRLLRTFLWRVASLTVFYYAVAALRRAVVVVLCCRLSWATTIIIDRSADLEVGALNVTTRADQARYVTTVLRDTTVYASTRFIVCNGNVAGFVYVDIPVPAPGRRRIGSAVACGVCRVRAINAVYLGVLVEKAGAIHAATRRSDRESAKQS
jgi:hypothetical protein